MRLSTLKRSAEFHRIRGGARWATPAFVLETRPREPVASTTLAMTEPRFGFTVTKKLGGAVVRNRIRRRLKAAIQATGAERARTLHDYVVVARGAALDLPFAELQAALAAAFDKVHRPPRQAGSGAGGNAPPKAPAKSRPHH